jgi:hypothetical protein
VIKKQCRRGAKGNWAERHGKLLNSESGTDSRKARGAQTPGGERISEEIVKALRDRDSEGWVKAGFGRPDPSPGEEQAERLRRGDAGPLEGEKPKGGSSHTGRVSGEEATDFRRGKTRKAGEVLEARAPGPVEPTPGGEGRPRGRRKRGKGKPSEGESQERYGLKDGREVSGGGRRQEGGKP